MLVCHCAAVYDARIRAVIAAGARDLASVASACGAGSFCGGCRPTVATLLAGATGQPLAAFTVAAQPSPRLGTRPQATVHEIEQELAAAGWPVGEAVGSVAELAQRYGVDERTASDAVGTARHHGFVTGPPEALRVGEPSLPAVALAVELYLHVTGVGVDEVVDARRTLQPVAPHGAADAAGNPLFGVFAEILAQQTRDRRDHEPGDEVGGDVTGPVARVARALVDDIRTRRVPPGKVIGSQADLARRHGVDRAALRAAIRLLEYYSIAQLQRGRGGGLVVSPTEPWAVAQLLALYLEYVGAEPAQVLEVRHALELRSAELAAERIGAEGVDRLRRRLEVERDAQERHLVGFHNVHPLIAELSGYRVIALFAGALTLTVLRQVERRGMLAGGAAVLDAETTAAHAAIVEAIVAGDAELARRRMLEHIDRHEGGVGADAP